MNYHFFKGNVLHLSPSIMEGILKNANETNGGGIKEHFFYISLFDSKMLYNYRDSSYEKMFASYGFTKFEYIKSKVRFIYILLSLKSGDNVFFHGCPSPYYLQLLLYIIMIVFGLKRKAKSMSMICWGESDFYYSRHGVISMCVQYIYGLIFPKLKSLITISPGDTALAKKLYPNASIIEAPYFSDREIVYSQVEKDELTIMVSHSGWPHNNHIQSFNLLSKFSKNNIRVICPLCYGDKEYINYVVEKGKSIFGDKFSYFTDLKSKDEYIDFLRTVDIYITSASIQTGLFALMTIITSGGKVFLTGNLLYSMNQYGFVVEDLNKIGEYSFNELSQKITKEEYNLNISVYVSKYSNLKDLQQKWKNIYSN